MHTYTASYKVRKGVFEISHVGGHLIIAFCIIWGRPRKEGEKTLFLGMRYSPSLTSVAHAYRNKHSKLCFTT